MLVKDYTAEGENGRKERGGGRKSYSYKNVSWKLIFKKKKEK